MFPVSVHCRIPQHHSYLIQPTPSVCRQRRLLLPTFVWTDCLHGWRWILEREVKQLDGNLQEFDPLDHFPGLNDIYCSVLRSIDPKNHYVWTRDLAINNFSQLVNPLRHYATSRNVAGSIPDEAIGFFNWPNPSCRTMSLESSQPLREMSTRNLSGGKGRPELMADNLTTICELSV
jgi:hypothetical protein